MKFSTRLKNRTSSHQNTDVVFSQMMVLAANRSFDPAGQAKIDLLKDTMKYGWRWICTPEHQGKLPLESAGMFLERYYPHTQERLECCGELEYIGRAYVVLETTLRAAYFADRLSPMRYNKAYFEDLQELAPIFFVLKRRLDLMKLSEKEEGEIVSGIEKMHADLNMAYRLQFYGNLTLQTSEFRP